MMDMEANSVFNLQTLPVHLIRHWRKGNLVKEMEANSFIIVLFEFLAYLLLTICTEHVRCRKYKPQWVC